MAAKLFKIEIYTPEREFYKAEIESLIINTNSGEMGILFQTLPIVTILKAGIMKIFQNNKWMEAVHSDGVMTVTDTEVSVLVESAYWPYEIDVEQVNEEINILDAKEKKAKSIQEYKMAKAQLAIQFAKLKIKNRNL